MFDSVNLSPKPPAGFRMDSSARRVRYRSKNTDWQSLLVQRPVYAPVVENLVLPGTPSVRLLLAEAGRATMEKRTVGERGLRRYEWAPGRLVLKAPNQPLICSYRATAPLRSVAVEIPLAIVERTAEQLGGRALDYERMAASIRKGDPFLKEAIRTVGAANEVGDLYAESAATFLAMHLLTRHSGPPDRSIPVREDARIRTAIAVMRGRLAEPLTLADIANEVHLSVYHFVRVFKEATGETPHRFLNRLRVEEAQRLLHRSDLSIAEIATRCGFASPGTLSTAFLRHTGIRPSAYRDV